MIVVCTNLECSGGDSCGGRGGFDHHIVDQVDPTDEKDASTGGGGDSEDGNVVWGCSSCTGLKGVKGGVKGARERGWVERASRECHVLIVSCVERVCV